MILRCAIIDDEPLALDLMESYVKKTPFLSLCGRYSSAVEAMDSLRENPVDLLFLDIQMPELDGLEFSRMTGKECRIIFTTAFSQYALDGYKVDALDYLLKPVSYQEFLKAADKALEWFSLKNRSEEKSRIFVKSEYNLIGIETARILYVEALKDYVKICLEGEARPVLSLMSLKSLEGLLPADRFVRVHRSYIVQPSKVRVIERNHIVFGKERIPISDNYRQAFFDALSAQAIVPQE